MCRKPIFSLGNAPGTVLSYIPANSDFPDVMYGTQAQRAWDSMCESVHDEWKHERTETISVLVWRAVQKFWEDRPPEPGLRVFDCDKRWAFLAVGPGGQDMLDIVWRAAGGAQKIKFVRDAKGATHVC